MIAIKRAIEPYEKKKAEQRKKSGKPPANFAEGENARNKVAGFIGLVKYPQKSRVLLLQQNKKEPEKYQLVNKLVSSVDNKLEYKI